MPEKTRRCAIAEVKFRLNSAGRVVMQAAAIATCIGGGAAMAQQTLPQPVRMMVPENLAPVAPTSLSVELLIDFAVILQIAGDVSSVVIGNADIADVSVVAAGTIALTGQALGTTNVVVLGPEGDVLAELNIRVAGQKPGTVTVRRALLASIYDCTESSCRYNDDAQERVASAE